MAGIDTMRHGVPVQWIDHIVVTHSDLKPFAREHTFPLSEPFEGARLQSEAGLSKVGVCKSGQVPNLACQPFRSGTLPRALSVLHSM